MDTVRTLETHIARLTLIALAVFAPIETYASWQMLGGAKGLIHPSYIVTFTAMVLMLVGARHSLRARPRCSPALMCISHAWIVAYGLRAVIWRTRAVGRGLELHFGIVELWATAAAVTVGVAMLCVSLVLTLRASGAGGYPPSLRTLERRLAIFALGVLTLFVPIETWATVQMGGAAALIRANYLQKVAGMLLLVVGARHALRAGPRGAPAVLCAGCAWSAATLWSATVNRLVAIGQGAELWWGSVELAFVVISTVIALGSFAVALYLTIRWSSLAALKAARIAV